MQDLGMISQIEGLVDLQMTESVRAGMQFYAKIICEF